MPGVVVDTRSAVTRQGERVTARAAVVAVPLNALAVAALRPGAGRRVVFAGSDLANGWNGFLDGAIESELAAARSVASLPGEETPAQVACPARAGR